MTEQASPIRVGVWAAVSSTAQADEDKTSLEDQERQGREFARAIGGHVVAVYRTAHTRDVIFYEDAAREMASYRDLRSDVEENRIDVLWALDADRLGRDPALSQQVLSLVEKNGGEVYLASAPHTVGQKTIAHRYIAAIQSVRAGEDQALRKHRQRSGMRGRIEKRGLLAGRLPFYLDQVRDDISGQVIRYEFNDRVGALDLMTELFLAGYSYAQIRRRLEDSSFRPPRSKTWWVRTIQINMNSDVPAGYAEWGPFRSDGPSPHIPVRWDEQTHQAVIRERQRRERVGYHRIGAGPLKGVAFCNRCKSHLLRTYQYSRGYRYLRCGLHAQKSVYPHFECHTNHIREEVALAAVAQFLQDMSTPEVLDAFLAEMSQGDQAAELQRELASAERAIENLEQQRLRLAHALAAGQMEVSIYRQTDDDLLARLEAERVKATGLRQTASALPDEGQLRQALQDLAKNWDRLLEKMEPAEISTMLQDAGLRIYVDSGEVVRITLG